MGELLDDEKRVGIEGDGDADGQTNGDEPHRLGVPSPDAHHVVVVPVSEIDLELLDVVIRLVP